MPDLTSHASRHRAERQDGRCETRSGGGHRGGAVKNVDAGLAGTLFRSRLGSPQLKERTLGIALGGFFTVSQGL